ncbi:MAG TPA: hypothetical protein VHH36_09570 [Candidatus Thermoplasmatota archaeon]|nr:hypothetical protein [Candidatus Thermoplasmatota archaeon]
MYALMMAAALAMVPAAQMSATDERPIAKAPDAPRDEAAHKRLAEAAKLRADAAEKHSDRPAKDCRAWRCDAPAFRLRAVAPLQRAAGNETIAYTLVAEAKRNVSLDLSAGPLPRGYAVSIEPASVKVGPGEPARVHVKLTVPERAHAVTFAVKATGPDGHEEVARLGIVAKSFKERPFDLRIR